MSELRFRKMVKADLPVITKIENDCQSHPWTLLQFLDGFNAGYDCWIASKEYEQREMLVGFSVVAERFDIEIYRSSIEKKLHRVVLLF